MTVGIAALTIITLVCQQLATARLPVQRVVVSGGDTIPVGGLRQVLQACDVDSRLWLETTDDHWVQLHPRYGWSSLEDCSAGVDDLIAPCWRYAAQQQLRSSGRLAAIPKRVYRAVPADLRSVYDYNCPHCMGTGMHTINPDEEPGCTTELTTHWTLEDPPCNL